MGDLDFGQLTTAALIPLVKTSFFMLWTIELLMAYKIAHSSNPNGYKFLQKLRKLIILLRSFAQAASPPEIALCLIFCKF